MADTEIKTHTNYTLCIPTSIIGRANAPNLQQATAILYQLAKAATIHNVGEIVVLDPQPEGKKIKFDEKDKISDDAMFIATVLQYFVTPPYLMKGIFKKKFWANFQYAKDLPKLTRLPFMAPGAQAKFREGLTVAQGKVSKPMKKKGKPLTNTKYVNVGHGEYLELQGQQVPLNVRVTVDTQERKIVSPSAAYDGQTGVNSSYGYHVRIASKFAKVFTESSYPEGYTQTLFVSGGDYHRHTHPKLTQVVKPSGNLLLVVSSWKELESVFQNEKFEGVSDVKEFFDGEVSVPWGVRVEDAAMVALAKLSI